jgi:hypothetical protein
VTSAASERSSAWAGRSNRRSRDEEISHRTKENRRLSTRVFHSRRTRTGDVNQEDAGVHRQIPEPVLFFPV